MGRCGGWGIGYGVKLYGDDTTGWVLPEKHRTFHKKLAPTSYITRPAPPALQIMKYNIPTSTFQTMPISSITSNCPLISTLHLSNSTAGPHAFMSASSLDSLQRMAAQSNQFQHNHVHPYLPLSLCKSTLPDGLSSSCRNLWTDSLFGNRARDCALFFLAKYCIFLYGKEARGLELAWDLFFVHFATGYIHFWKLRPRSCTFSSQNLFSTSSYLEIAPVAIHTFLAGLTFSTFST